MTVLPIMERCTFIYNYNHKTLDPQPQSTIGFVILIYQRYPLLKNFNSLFILLHKL